MRYAKVVLQTVAASFPPRTSMSIVQKTVGRMWRELSHDEQLPYREAFKAESAARKGQAASTKSQIAVAT